MIIEEYHTIRTDGVKLYRTYSNEGFKVKQVETDNVYDEAIDVENSSFNYIEINEKVID